MKVKCSRKSGSCYSAACINQTHDQKRFTVSELARQQIGIQQNNNADTVVVAVAVETTTTITTSSATTTTTTTTTMGVYSIDRWKQDASWKVRKTLSWGGGFYARQHVMLCASLLRQRRPSVCPSVCHTAVLCQNDATEDHEIFTV